MPSTPEQFTLLGHRPSSLDTAFYCGQSAALNAEHGAGRAALVGTVFHATCSNAPDLKDLRALLTIDERNLVDSLNAPLPIEVNGHRLTYAEAEHELPVGLTRDGLYAASGEVLTGGTLDLAWFHEGVAYVADIKKRTGHIEAGPDSLQLAAYGLAYASKVGADYLCMGLWDATDAFWLWGGMLELEWDGPELFERVRAAALNRGEYTTGRHCHGCWARLHCPEHVLPAIVKRTELAALADGNITPENAPELLRIVKAGLDVFNQAEKTLKAYAAQTPIRDNGKVWGPRQQKGRESVSVKAVREEFGEAAERVITRGAPYDVFAWTKEK